MTGYEKAWLEAFIFTQLIEVVVGLIWLKVIIHQHVLSWFQTILVIFSATTITHPPLWFLLPKLMSYFKLSYLSYLIIGEVLVILCETWWYRWTCFQKQSVHAWGEALKLSLTVNCTSWWLGNYFLNH